MVEGSVLLEGVALGCACHDTSCCPSVTVVVVTGRSWLLLHGLLLHGLLLLLPRGLLSLIEPCPLPLLEVVGSALARKVELHGAASADSLSKGLGVLLWL